jgi:type II secretory pathway component PulF
MGLTSALDSLDALTVRYEGIRIFRQLLVKRLLTLTAIVLAAVAWLHLLPWTALVAVSGIGASMVGVVVRAEQRARRRCRACAIEVARISRILPQTGTRPTAR